MTSSSGRASSRIPGPPSPAPDAPDPLGGLARARFGVGYLYPIQRFVISNVLEGTPQVVVLPTGAGKSLCFQLPSLLLPGPTLVLVPLLSLLSDQMRKLADAGITEAGCLRGGLPPAEKAALFRRARDGAMRLLLATPEACLAASNLEELRLCRISHLVVDEAHCVSEWGQSFRPAYLRVGEIARAIGVSTISAFTATASPAVIERIRTLVFGDAEPRIVAGSADRPNISYSVRPMLSRGHALADLALVAAQPMLLFCRTRSGVEVAARALRRRRPGIPVRFYHAGLSREERADVERWFLPAREGVLVATCAYGMGVDKPDIRTVAHADVPSSVEAYLQESGRAGRDGLSARALLLTSAEDEAFQRRLEDPVARQRYAGMLRYARSASLCRRNALLALIGQEPVACAGCDVCAGTVAARPEGEGEILSLVARHQRRFFPSEAASILCGAPGPVSVRGFQDCINGYSTLRRWTWEDTLEAIEAMTSGGSLRLSKRGPWRGRLTFP